jgi:hypothetical protein
LLGQHRNPSTHTAFVEKLLLNHAPCPKFDVSANRTPMKLLLWAARDPLRNAQKKGINKWNSFEWGLSTPT